MIATPSLLPSNRWSYKSKLTTFLAIPVITIIVFTLSEVHTQTKVLDRAQSNAESIQLTTKISKLINSLQKERGLSAQYLVAEPQKLNAQWQNTDRLITQLQCCELNNATYSKVTNYETYDSNTYQAVGSLNNNLDNLPLIRSQTDKTAQFLEYKKLINQALRFLVSSHQIQGNNQLDNLVELVWLEEYMHLELGELFVRLQDTDFPEEIKYQYYPQLHSHIETQHNHLNNFLSQSSNSLKSLLKNHIVSPQASMIESYRDTLSAKYQNLRQIDELHQFVSYSLLNNFTTYFKSKTASDYQSFSNKLEQSKGMLLRLRNRWSDNTELLNILSSLETLIGVFEKTAFKIQSDSYNETSNSTYINESTQRIFKQLGQLKSAFTGFEYVGWLHTYQNYLLQFDEVKSTINYEVAEQVSSQKDIALATLLSYLLASLLTIHGTIWLVKRILEKLNQDISSISSHMTSMKESERFDLFLPEYDSQEINNLVESFNSLLSKQQGITKKVRIANSLFKSTSQGLIVTDKDNKIIITNPAFTKITGYSADEAQGQLPSILKSGKHDNNFYFRVWESLILTGFWQGELWNKRKDGSIYPQSTLLNCIRNEVTGEIEQYVSLFLDNTTSKENEERLWQQAKLDSLTGLANRKFGIENLENALIKAQHYQQKVALLFIDLDKFKYINDSLGHDAGDQLLIEVSQRLQSIVGEAGTVARFGGDEFVIIYPNYQKLQDIELLAKQITLANEDPLYIDRVEMFATSSIGIATYPEQANSCEELLKQADIAMYQAKSNGKNIYQLYHPEMEQYIKESIQLENDLRKAISNKELVLHYQPIVDSKTLEVVGVESLIRWRHPKQGLLSPNLFIPTAEESGQILEITIWVLEQAIEQIHRWQQDNIFISISVNVPSTQISSDAEQRFQQTVKDSLQKYNVAGEYLHLEITESALMANNQQTLTNLAHLRELGIKISMDDFGTGYSSLSYLKSFAIDILKVDRSFIAGMFDDSKSIALLNTILDMARHLELEVICEGVESEEQLTYLQKIGEPYIQGYYFSKPLPVDEVTHFITNKKTSLSVSKT